jgi:serine/threonine protein kinase
MLKNLHEETVSLKKLYHHPNIIKQFASFKTKRHFYLIVEYCNGGDLENLLEQGLYLSERHIRYIYREVLKGMREMHEIGILHRDIKNANILLHMPTVNPTSDVGKNV